MPKTTPVFNEIRRNVAGIDIAGHADHYVCGPRREGGGLNGYIASTSAPAIKEAEASFLSDEW